MGKIDTGKQMRRIRIRKTEWLTVFFFLLLFIVGIAGAKDYGISYDEIIERNSSLITYKYIVPGLEETVTDTVNFSALPDLPVYVDRYYGMVLQEIPVIIEHIFGFQLSYRNVFFLRHFFTFCVFFVGLLYFFFFLKECGFRKRYCFLGVFMLFLSPRILADACYNIKDLPFMCLTIVTLFYCIRFIRYGKLKEGVLWCLSGALCANVRVVGALFFAIGELLYLFGGEKEKFVKRLRTAVGLGSVCLLLYVLMMPALWENPVQGIIEILTSFSNFSRWGGANYYLGQWYPEGTEPWHYIFVWIFATTPIAYTVCFTGGLLCAIKKFVKKEKDITPILLCGLCTLIPILYLLVGHPVVYNGWRHFFFLHPLFLYFAILFVDEMERGLFGNKHVFYLVVSGLGGSFIITSSWMLKNHPYEYVYFNPLIREYAMENLEKDYWAVSEYVHLKEIVKEDKSDLIKVYVVSGSGNGCYRLADEDRRRILLVDETGVPAADYVVKTYALKEESFPFEYLFQRVKDVTVDGTVISSLFQRNASLCGESVFKLCLEEDGVVVKSTLTNFSWSLDEKDDELFLRSGEICTQEAVALRRLVIDKKLYEALTEACVEIDAQKRWYMQSDFTFCGGEYVLELPAECEGNLRIQLGVGREKLRWEGGEAWCSVRVVADREETDHLQRGLSTQLDFIQTNYNENELALILDNDNKTRWSSGSAQTEGMYLLAALKEKQTLCGVKLSLGDSLWDYPVALHIFTSEDGQDWQEAAYQTEDLETYWFDSIDCRYIRFELGETAQETTSHWSVYEMELFCAVEKDNKEK